jgi:excinuclease ABC subunit C
MAFQNAREDIIRLLRERGDTPALEELKTLLDLDNLPLRIEGFDIAHIGGKFPVASLISFYNGNPDKKNYRYFRLKTTDGIIDDFASMKEAVSRRYTRLLNEQQDLPDLILIDGGIGQVNAAEGILQSLDLDIPIIGLAEKNEEIYLPGNSTPLILPRRSDALRLLQRVRDETHRFATSKNQKLRTKENTESPLLQIPNIGEKRALLLQKEFTTLENLCNQEESKVAQLLHIKADEATDILLNAKNPKNSNSTDTLL